MKGLIVVGHGSRSKDAAEVFFRIVEGLREKTGGSVEGCFMETSKPDIPSTFDRMYQNGVREFTVLPYFLFNGIHIKEDIPEILESIKERYEGIKINMAEPLGYHECIISMLMERAEGDVKCI